jgi:hypothetical protein
MNITQYNYPIKAVSTFTNRKGQRKTSVVVAMHDAGEVFTAPTDELPLTGVYGVCEATIEEVFVWVETLSKNANRKLLVKQIKGI